ncbi:YIP1 family protein [Vulgatibacter incomptus]|uniref:Yip1 domain-containing protein n=1 Tax=Vulgatibacter incomptus TaxID=1391653 RepID=A0A0K1PI23_9BACT|nr:Yip1 family protein [Vulgatibacter incomptus]AKU93056.1 hypothetical protein AKJ08_3443 [Vulgatibacter incomptus]
MQVKCPWCQGTFESDRYGRQFCIRCGAELDLPEPDSSSTGGSRGPQPAAPRDEAAAPHEGPSGAPAGHREAPAGAVGSHAGPTGEREAGSHVAGSEGGEGGPPGGDRGRITSPTPWERRDGMGFFPALFETWKDATFRPAEFFANLAPAGVGPAFAYAMIFGTIGTLATGLWNLLFVPNHESSPVPPGLQIVLGPFFFAIAIWCVAAVVHLCCLILGCGKRGFEATFRAIAYSLGPSIFAVVPGIGSLVAGVWSLVLEIVGIQHMQRTTGARAVAVIFLPLLAFLLCICAVGLAAGALGMAGALLMTRG